MSLRITLTGQLAAEADGNRADATHLPGRQASMVFAYLVAERDRPVPTEELAEAVWGTALPPTWRPALRGVISKVRDFLDLLGIPAAAALTSSSGCYRLVLPTDTSVDVEAAEGEADAARRALDQGRLGQALAAAERARAVAGRPLLPGLDGAWVEDRRAALHLVHVRSLEVLVDVHLAAGRPALAVGPAGDLVALEPFRDSAYRRLLRAHTASGDRGEALRSYDRYRRVLAEELGVGPSPELEAAYLELLHAEPAGGARDGPAAVGGPPRPGAVRRRLRRPGAGAAPAARRLVRRAAGPAPDRAGGGRGRHRQDPAGDRAGRPGRAGRRGGPGGTLRPAPRRPLSAVAGGGRPPAGRLPVRAAADPARPRAAALVRFWPELAWRLPAALPPSQRSAPRPTRTSSSTRSPGCWRRWRSPARCCCSSTTSTAPTRPPCCCCAAWPRPGGRRGC